MAMLDSLAARLSDRTGSKFEVLRCRPPIRVAPGRMVPNKLPPVRYVLEATRDGVSYRFQAHRPLPEQEMLRWLASLNDMVAMGFIPVSRG